MIIGHFNTGFKGGVKVTESPEKIRDFSREMIGHRLITAQTGPEGQEVRKVLVHEGIDFNKELYLAFLMDRAHNGPVIVASPQGGQSLQHLSIIFSNCAQFYYCLYVLNSCGYLFNAFHKA